MTKLFDFINTLIENSPAQYKNNSIDYSILCEQYPTKYGSYNKTYKAKVLYVCFIKGDGGAHRFYPPDFERLGLTHIIITENTFRTIGIRKAPFWLNGTNTQNEFNGNPYYNYSINNITANCKPLIAQLREKYNITAPVPFVGKQHELVIEDSNIVPNDAI